MSRARTLLQMRTRVRKLADCVGDTTTGRHTNTEINTMINESWQAMRELVSDNGHQFYLKPAIATMTAGATSPYPFGTISMPSDCVRVFGLDVQASAADVRSLTPISFSERNEFVGTYGQTTGVPCSFYIFSVGVESTTSVTPGTIAIFPPPAAGYQYTLWYLPSWTDITTDAWVFDGVAGWDDWVSWDCVLKLAATDNDMAATAQLALQMKADAESRLMKGSDSMQRVGPIRRIDTSGMRNRDRNISTWGRR